MNAAQLPLIAGVLAVLALGVVSAAPGVALAPGAAAPSCPLHLHLNVPAQVPVGGPFPLSAVASSGPGCHLTVSSYAFSGVPGQSGVVRSTSGVVMAFPSTPGTYDITVIVETNLGGMGAASPMVVL